MWRLCFYDNADVERVSVIFLMIGSGAKAPGFFFVFFCDNKDENDNQPPTPNTKQLMPDAQCLVPNLNENYDENENKNKNKNKNQPLTPNPQHQVTNA